MPDSRKNRKVLCFVDEHGTAGQAEFAIGCVIVFARMAGRVDKLFSDQLESNANEVHGSEWSFEYLQSVLVRFSAARPSGLDLVMMNRKAREQGKTSSRVYGQAFVATVSTGLRIFREQVRLRQIRNVQVLVDLNQHNSSETFQEIVRQAKESYGHFRAVESVAAIDSAASRLLQLADIVAYSRTWIDRGKTNSGNLERQYGILSR